MSFTANSEDFSVGANNGRKIYWLLDEKAFFVYNGSKLRTIQAFKWALLFLFFLLFPTFLICSYFSLLFHENALLSLLFQSKISVTRKNLEIIPHSLRSLGFYKLTSMFVQGARPLAPQFLMLSLKISLFGLYYCHMYYPAHLI